MKVSSTTNLHVFEASNYAGITEDFFVQEVVKSLLIHLETGTNAWIGEHLIVKEVVHCVQLFRNLV